MKRKILAICSVLIAAIVVIAAVPGCTPTEPEPEATINVAAIDLCDGQPWEGLVTYTLTHSDNTTVTGYSAPDSQTVAPGTWTLTVDVGGPPNAFVHNITPSATQTVAEDGTKTFTVEFNRDLDAEISFVTWTINGVPVADSWAPFAWNVAWPGDVIGLEFQQRVRGCPGINVNVTESIWFGLYYVSAWQDFPLQGGLHVANNDSAVVKVPTYAEGARHEKLSQEIGVWDYYGIWPCLSWNFSTDWLGWTFPAPVTYNFTFVVPSVQLNEISTWGLETGPLYDKSLDFLQFGMYGFAPEESTLFQLSIDQTWDSMFVLLAGIQITMEGDVNPANNGWWTYDPPLSLYFPLGYIPPYC